MLYYFPIHEVIGDANQTLTALEIQLFFQFLEKDKNSRGR